jgi:hypothetical protein
MSVTVLMVGNVISVAILEILIALVLRGSCDVAGRLGLAVLSSLTMLWW